jgi:hypothetical protein
VEQQTVIDQIVDSDRSPTNPPLPTEQLELQEQTITNEIYEDGSDRSPEEETLKQEERVIAHQENEAVPPSKTPTVGQNEPLLLVEEQAESSLHTSDRPTELFTEASLAEDLGCVQKTINNWRNKGHEIFRKKH